MHESVDYQKLKVSVFNEDKRTDLIGECWIGLDSVLRRGGGQDDAWHDLNAKGRYAGQVRIEMTFYDTRPREEPEPELESLQESLQAQNEINRVPDARAVGPRQPPQVQRRPLPSTGESLSDVSGEPKANSLPMPNVVPPNHNTFPRQDERHYSELNLHHSQHATPYYSRGMIPEFEHGPGLCGHPVSAPTYEYAHQPSYFASPQVSFGRGHDPQDYGESNEREFFEQDVSFTDDPQALEAVQAAEQHDNNQDAYEPPPVAPLKYHRAPGIARAGAMRPPQPPAPPHSHSAPVLAPSQQHTLDRGSATVVSPRHGYRERAQYSSMHQHDRANPPPPPSHRNSAPVIPARTPQKQSPLQVSSGPHRPLHHATSSQDFAEETLSNDDFYGQPDHCEDHSNYDYSSETERRRSGGGAAPISRQVEHGQQRPFGFSSSSAYTEGNEPPAGTRVQALNPVARPRPQSMEASPSPYSRQNTAPAATSAASVPLVRPTAMSPNINAHRSSPPVARKPVTSSVSLPSNTIGDLAPTEPSDMPFSPDSFAQFNPQMQQPSTGPQNRNPFDNNRQAQPMYHDNVTEPPRPGSSGTTTSNEPPRDSFGRIVRSDGRRVDPSDHLPSSTYAPEPEPKGRDKERRANIKVNVKTRFGPREATPPKILPKTSEAPATPSPPVRGTPPAPFEATPPQPAIAPARQTPPAYTVPRNAVNASSPLQSLEKSGWNRLQKRTPSGSTPLAPSTPSALNSNYYPQRNSAPPPVPGKIPLDAPDYAPSHLGYNDQNTPHEYSPSPLTLPAVPPTLPTQRSMPSVPSIPSQQPRRHNHVGGAGYQVEPGSSPSMALSHEINQIDLGPSPSREFAAASTEPRYGGLGGRLRRSRFGA